MSLLNKFMEWLFGNNIPSISLTTSLDTPTTATVDKKDTSFEEPINQTNISYTATPEALEIIQQWLIENNVVTETIGEMLYKILGFTYEDTIDIKKQVIPIDSSYRTDGFLGSIVFEVKGKSANKNISNYLSSSEINNSVFRHRIVFYKDYALLYVGVLKKKSEDREEYSQQNALTTKIIIFKNDKNEIQINSKDYLDSYQLKRKYPYERYYTTYSRGITPDETEIYIQIPDKFQNTRYLLCQEVAFYQYLISIIPNTLQNITIKDQSLLHSLRFPPSFTNETIESIFEKVILEAGLNEEECKQIKVSHIRIERVYQETNSTYTDNTDYYLEAIYTYDKSTGRKQITLCSKNDCDNEEPSQISCSFSNEFNEDTSISSKIIEVTYGVEKSVITVRGYGDIKIENEIQLRQFLLSNYLMNNIDGAFYDIANISFQDPPSNYISVELSLYKDGQLIDKRGWNNPNPTLENTNHLSRKKIQTEDN